MTKTNVELGLRGAFKADIYDGQDNLVETTDWFDNFITQTGLYYPTLYSFADCFRFLTLGTNASPNRGGLAGANTDTTGCYQPITDFIVTDTITSTHQSAAWMGHEGYATGTNPVQNSSCQTVTSASGIRFYRAWTVPSGVVGTVVNEGLGYLNVQEFAVSPGSGGDPLGCFAFSRVQRQLPIKNGFRAIVSYQLQINCPSYALSTFSGGTFLTGGADTTNDYDLVDQWGKLSGNYRQVWNGLNCIDSYGVTFIPKFGNALEPSITDLSNCFFYLSPDNAFFDVNGTGGGDQTNSDTAWASDGVMKPLTQSMTLTAKRDTLGGSPQAIYDLFYGEPQFESSIPSDSDMPFNIRLGGISDPLRTPDIRNYTVKIADEPYNNTTFNYQGPSAVDASSEVISYATPGASGLNLSRDSDRKQKAIFSTSLYGLPINMDEFAYGTASNYNLWTGRKKNVQRKAIFSPAQSMGYNSRFGSLVFGYMYANATVGDYFYYPLIDSLFYDNSGRSLMQHYRLVSGVYLTQRGTGVAGCTIKIFPQGNGNVNRFVSRRTFQGPVSGYVQLPGWVLDPTGTWRYGNVLSGVNSTGVGRPGELGTSGDSSFWSASYGGCSGWGAIIGVMGDDYNNASDPGWSYYDMGIADHNVGSLSQPTGGNPSKLYWPHAYQGAPLYVDFSNIIFRKIDGTLWPDNPSFTAAQLASSSGFCRPTGYIYHFDGIGAEGYRLLSNHGMGNTDPTNNHYDPPLYGGTYPALSMDNGMEFYLDLAWSSDCKGAVECLDPPS